MSDIRNSDDYIDPEATRRLQASLGAIEANYRKILALGIYNIVKVTPRGARRDTVGGYLTAITEIIGKSASQIESILGLKSGSLASGADDYRLERLPEKDEFHPRGYTSLVDGLTLKPQLQTDKDGYRRGQSAWQISLKDTVRIPAILLDSLQGDKRFDPGTHPRTAARYPEGHPARARLRP